jgi:hypothetical protein
VCQCPPATEKEVWELNHDGTLYVKVKKFVSCDENCINRYVVVDLIVQDIYFMNVIRILVHMVKIVLTRDSKIAGTLGR